MIKKATPQRAEGTKEDNGSDFWMCETGTGQQAAHLLDCYMMMMMMMTMTLPFHETKVDRGSHKQVLFSTSLRPLEPVTNHSQLFFSNLQVFQGAGLAQAV
jgi:hypothetical protein